MCKHVQIFNSQKYGFLRWDNLENKLELPYKLVYYYLSTGGLLCCKHYLAN